MAAETSLSTHRVSQNDATKGVPTFLLSLYELEFSSGFSSRDVQLGFNRIVDDKSTDYLIRWSKNGDSFFIRQPDRFMQEVAGTRFKLIDYSIFVYLLKKYQFRRITHRQQGALCSDRIHGYHHYTHFFFVRNQQILLSYIQRKDLPVLGYPVQASGVGGQSQTGLKSEIDSSLERPERSLLLLEETTRILKERSKKSRDECSAIRNKLPALQASEVCGQSQPGLKSKIDLSLEKMEKSLLLMEETTRKLNEMRNQLGDSLRQSLGSQLAESGIA